MKLNGINSYQTGRVLIIGVVLLTVHFASSANNSQDPPAEEDNGYLFLGPRVEIKSKMIKKDQIIKAFVSEGVRQRSIPGFQLTVRGSDEHYWTGNHQPKKRGHLL